MAISEYQKVEGSEELVSSTLDVFAIPPIHTSVLDGGWTEIIPTIISDEGDIQIDIPASSTFCYNLKDSYLKTQVQIVKDDGSRIPDNVNDVEVCPNDCFLPSLFKRVDLRINENVVESETNYPQRAYLETLLGADLASKNSKLKITSGWYEDKNLAKDGNALDDATFKARVNGFKDSTTRTYAARLHLDLFSQDRPILPRNQIRLYFERANSKFSLMAANNAPADGGKVHIKQCTLYLRYSVLNPAVTSGINKGLLAGNTSKYPIGRVDTKIFTIAAGSSYEDRVIQSSGQLPSRVLVVLMNQLAVNGAYDLNPFRFSDYKVSTMELNAGGKLIERYEPNFATGDYAREYFQVLAINSKESDNSGTISPEEFADGRSVFAFDLTKDREEGPHLISTGNLNLKMIFREALPHTVSFMVYTIKDDTVLMDVSQRISRTGDKVGS